VSISTALALVTLLTLDSLSRSGLTTTERFWIESGLEVVRYAREQKLPLDLVVQPQPTPGASPLSMGFVEGRCKLVYSMRGNPSVAVVRTRPQFELPASILIETMTAHEIGHCWRHVQGLWQVPPPGVLQGPAEGADGWQQQLREMQATRREEAFADLVALAWISKRRPEHYRAVHAWLAHWRADDSQPGSHHDTSTWLHRVRELSDFAAGGTLFEQVQSTWRAGARDED
jgi:hypothetical protein